MIIVLRLDHRVPRDERITTHVCLVARAFGADKMIYTGQHDQGMKISVDEIAKKWGGNFKVEYSENGEKIVNELRKNGFKVAHLTMYGIPLMEKIERIKEEEKLLIIVGGSQVPVEYYRLSDFNVSVTTQPHSEVSSLAIFLDRYNEGEELNINFKDSKIRIKPSEKGKIVEE